MINKPEYDHNLQQWRVKWDNARFWFHKWDAANTFYLENS